IPSHVHRKCTCFGPLLKSGTRISASVSSTEALHHLMYTAPHFAWTVGGRAALREPACGSSVQTTVPAFRRDRSSTQTPKRAWLPRQPPAGEKPTKQPP